MSPSPFYTHKKGEGLLNIQKTPASLKPKAETGGIFVECK
jgi:hypothetical protein